MSVTYLANVQPEEVFARQHLWSVMSEYILTTAENLL